MIVAIGIVSLWTPLMRPEIAQHWFSWPNIALLAPVPVVTLLVAAWVVLMYTAWSYWVFRGKVRADISYH